MSAYRLGVPINLEWGKRVRREAIEQLNIPGRHVVERGVITIGKMGVPQISIDAIPVEEKRHE